MATNLYYYFPMTDITMHTDLKDDVLVLDRRGENRVVEFLGMNFAPIDHDTLLKRILNHADSGEKYGYFLNPNVDVVVKYHKNPSWDKLVGDAWLSVSDSRILELLAKFSGIELPACPGSSLVEDIFQNHLKKDENINIIGGDKEIIEIVKNKYGLTNINWYDAPMGLKDKPEEVRKCAKFIADNKARFHFLCVGNPQQLMIAHEVLNFKDVTGVGMCVGASLDFIGGRTKRAPKWVQQFHIEWLFRLLSEPKRLWRRYLVEGPAIFKIWYEWKKKNQK